MASESRPTDAEIESRIVELIDRRALTSSICPSEVARSFSSNAAVWRPLMDPIRAVAVALAKTGAIEVAQGGQPVGDLDEIKGPVRLRRPQD